VFDDDPNIEQEHKVARLNLVVWVVEVFPCTDRPQLDDFQQNLVKCEYQDEEANCKCEATALGEACSGLVRICYHVTKVIHDQTKVKHEWQIYEVEDRVPKVHFLEKVLDKLVVEVGFSFYYYIKEGRQLAIDPFNVHKLNKDFLQLEVLIF